jgi:hypothetical protein
LLENKMAVQSAATSERQRLIEIIRRRSYGTGVEIKLSSGRTSNFYFGIA